MPPDIKEVSVFRIIIDYYCNVADVKLNVAITGDGGETYMSGATVTLDENNPSVLKHAFFDFLNTAEVLGARISCTGGLFRLVDVRLEIAPEGEVNA